MPQMADDLTVRPIEPADADGYLAVFESVAAEGTWIGTELPIEPERVARIRASATEPRDDEFTAVAVVDGRLVGFAHVAIDIQRAHLGMAIVDGHRGHGIGTRLLDACIAWRAAQRRTRSTSRCGRTTPPPGVCTSAPASSSRVVGGGTGGATTANCGTRSR